MTDHAAIGRADAPAWPAFAGFGALFGLLWLVDPASLRGTLPVLIALLLVSGVHSICSHLVGSGGCPTDGRGPIDR